MKKLKYLLMACCAACVWLAACSDDDYEPLPDWWWEQTGEPAVYPEPEPVDNKVVAHRGCYAETGFPQNSVAGLKKAEVPDVADGSGQLNVAHALTADLSLGHFNADRKSVV